MIKTLTIAVIALALSAGGALAKPAQCKDANGKFTKCPAAAAAPVTPAKPAPMAAAKPAANTAPMASAAGAPAGATAKCKDGAFSMSKHHSGSCSHHGGVASWLP